jgi:hypothetical protein
MKVFQSSPNLYAMTGKRNYIGLVKRYISTTFHICDEAENRDLEKVFQELKKIYIYVMEKYNCQTPIDTIYIILCPQKKYISFDERGGDVNSAYYVSSSRELAVYKSDEYKLRFIHELIHHILGNDECAIPPPLINSHPIFNTQEFSLLEICTEYHAMKTYLEMNPAINKNEIIKKRNTYLKEYASSIKDQTILARFLRYFIFPIKMLEQNVDNLDNIDYDLIYSQITKELETPTKYNNGIVYVYFIEPE